MGFVDFNSGDTFFSRSSLLVDLWVLFDELGFELVSPESLFTFSKFALALVSGEISASTKTENLAANSIRVLLEGKVRLGLGTEEGMKGLWSSEWAGGGVARPESLGAQEAL
jgi:hypothetical protein